MSMLRGKKLSIHDYYKEFLETQNSNKENITPNKTLVGRRTLKTPIIINDEDEQFVPLTQVDRISKSHSDSEAERRSSSFEMLLKSFFTANKNALNNSNTSEEHSHDKDSNNLSFEELMNKILTPDLPNLRPNRSEATSKPCTSVGINTQISNKSESSSKELTDAMLTPNLDNLKLDTRNTIMEISNSEKINTETSTISKVSKRTHKNDTNLVELTNIMLTIHDQPNLTLDKLGISTQSRNFDDPKIAKATEEADSSDRSFEELMKKLLTPDLPYPKTITRDKNVEELGTQTSFDEFSQNVFTPISSQNSKIDKVDDSVVDILPLPYLENLNNTETLNFTQPENVEINDNTCVKAADRKSRSIKKKSTVKKMPERSTTRSESNNEQNDLEEKTINILNILSEDITMPSSKIKFNNIGKIGTNEWLQFALNVIRKEKNGKKKGKRKHSVEVYNSYDEIYLTNTSGGCIKRNRRENTTICKMNTDSDSSQQYEFNEYESNTLQTCLNEVEQNLRLGIEKVLANKDLIPINVSTITQVDKDKMKTAINDLLVKLYAAFQCGKVPILMVRKRDYNTCIFEDGRLQLKPSKEATYKRCRPTKKYVYMLYVLGKAYSLLENDSQLTKREMFYQVKSLLISSPRLYEALDEVCCLLNVGRWHLNIVAHSGLVYGDLKLTWSSGEVTYCNTPDTMIPFNSDDIVEVQTTAYFIVVVEKESIFHKLLQEDLPNKLTRPFIMITGKGIPDFSTLQFLKKISTMVALPVFILVDADIYGIKIMLNYRFGTASNCYLSEYLAVPNARWLGVFPSEISKFGVPHLQMKKIEKTITKNVLKYPFIENHPMIKQELELLLKNNKKASIEGLIKNNTFLSESYLPTKFFNQDFI